MARKSSNEAKKGAPEWMATYSDLVTLLLCFFVMLFSMSTVDAEKFKAFINSFNNSMDIYYSGETIGDGASIGSGITQMPQFNSVFEKSLERKIQEIKKHTKEAAKKLTKVIKDKGLTSQIKVEYNDNLVKLVFIDDSMLFDTGKAELKEEVLQTLDTVSEELKQYSDQTIKVEGHTDNIPINTEKYPSNWYLSSARAISVAEYLIKEKGFNPESLSADGRGEFSPIGDNTTLEGRKKNRRVEITIFFDSE